MLLTRLMPSNKRTSNESNSFLYQQGAYLLLIVLIGSMMTGCVQTADDSLADHSFLTQQPCAPPCWYGLELDKSNEKEIYATLKKLPFVDQTTIGEGGTAWMDYENAKEISYGCLHPNVRQCGGALLSGDRLKRLWMSVGYALTFEAVVQQLGVPDYISYHPYHPEVGGCEVSLLWPAHQILVSSLDTKGDKACQTLKAGKGVDPSTRVTSIMYMVGKAFKPEPEVGWPYAPWPGFAKP